MTSSEAQPSEPSEATVEEVASSTTPTSSPLPADDVTQTTSPPQPPQPLHFSRKAIRQLENGSDALYKLAKSSKGSQNSRVSLAANELLREIVTGTIDKKTLDQLEFFSNPARLNEKDAQPVVFLAQGILAMGRSMAGLEDEVRPPAPPIRIKPPIDFGDDDEITCKYVVPSGSKKVHADDLDSSSNSETSGSTEDKEKPVGAENDRCVRIGAVHKFRPITPEAEIRKEPSFTPSPSPSPTLQAMLKRKRKETTVESSEDDDEDLQDFYDDDEPILESDEQGEEEDPSSSMEKEGIQCNMCDSVFYSNNKLDRHLVGYHRMKPAYVDDVSDDQSPYLDQPVAHQSQSRPTAITAVRRPSSHFQSRPSEQSHSIGASPVILSTRPLNVFSMQTQQQQHQQQQQAMRQQPAHMRASEQHRHSNTVVTSPGGTIRHYSSPSNAARAAAKAAAAAAAGVIRPNAPMKPYTCRQCGVVLTSQQMYASHVRYNHPKEKNGEGVPIQRQKSAADRKETAIVHLQMDDGTKAFKCRRCEKVFDSAQKVAGHSRHCLLVFEGKARPANQGPVPTEDRPYTVYRCGLNSDLARTCPYCGELLPSIRKVDKHVRTVHEASRHEVYGCSTCDRRFVTLGGIENHWLHYGDCPHGVLTVHKDGLVTLADIGDIPPPLKRPRMVMQAAATRRKEAIAAGDEDEDPSVSIVNAILGAHGFKVKGRDAPDLSPKIDEAERSATEDEEEAAPELEEYGEGEGEEEEEMVDTLLNGDSHLDEEMEEEEEGVEEESDEGGMNQQEKIIVSMKLVRCKHCKFFATTSDAMDSHMNEHHPNETLADLMRTMKNELEEEHEEEEDVLPPTSVSPELNEDVKQELIAPKLELIENAAVANGETQQTGEMRRMLGIASD